MEYKKVKIDGQQNHFDITVEKDGKEITFRAAVATEDQLDEVVQYHLDNLDKPPRAYTPTYSDSRRSEYPSFADQFDLLYHGGYDAWKAAIDDVKTKYPKS
jgi:hypothetical protein